MKIDTACFFLTLPNLKITTGKKIPTIIKIATVIKITSIMKFSTLMKIVANVKIATVFFSHFFTHSENHYGYESHKQFSEGVKKIIVANSGMILNVCVIH